MRRPWTVVAEEALECARPRRSAVPLLDLAERIYDWIFLVGYPDLWIRDPIEPYRARFEGLCGGFPIERGPRPMGKSSPLVLIRGEALACGLLRAVRARSAGLVRMEVSVSVLPVVRARRTA